MGNKKRTTCENPVIMSKFLKQNIIDVQAGANKCSVITEDIWFIFLIIFNYLHELSLNKIIIHPYLKWWPPPCPPKKF